MRAIETKVYNFNELSKEAQEKAIADYKQDMEYYSLEDDMNYELELLFDEYKIKNVNTEIRYSLSYCQGDGASFIGEIEYKGYIANIVTNQWGWYSHEKSVTVDEMTSLKTDRNASDKLVNELQSIIEEIGRKLGRTGYALIEDYTSDENVTQELIDGEYEFKENGEMI